MLFYLVVVVPLLLLVPVVLVVALLPRQTRALWQRFGPDRDIRSLRVELALATTQAATHTMTSPDSAASRAERQGPPRAGDTCDRCAMPAVAAVYLPHGRLLLCGHHGREHQSVLRTQGAVLVGELAFPDRRSPVPPR